MSEKDELERVRRQMDGREKAQLNREDYNQLHERQKEEYWNQKDRVDTFPLGPETNSSQRKLRHYYIITDPTLGIYQPQAAARSIAMHGMGFRAWHHGHNVDLANIQTTLFGRNVHTSITPNDNFDFEFATSAWPVKSDSASEFPTYVGAMVSVRASLQRNAISTRTKILGYKRTVNGHDVSSIGRYYQVELTNEPVSNPEWRIEFNRLRTPVNLFESWAPGNPHTGVLSRSSFYAVQDEAPMPVPGPLEQFCVRDIKFDMPFASNVATDPVKMAYVRGTADWPRACGMQVVKDQQYGTREFAIYVDAFNQFMIFPTSAIGPLVNPPYSQNVNDAMVWRGTLTFPSWVYKPAQRQMDYYHDPIGIDQMQAGLTDFPELDWKFNHLGTKAVTVAYERVPFDFDASYYAANVGGNPMTLSLFNSDYRLYMGVGLRTWTGVAIGYNDQRYFTAPGLIEATITITLTGPNPQDFTAGVSLVTKRQPSVLNTPCTMLAGYVWYDLWTTDKDKKRVKSVAAGDLIALELERWGDSAPFPPSPSIDEGEAYANLHIQNIMSFRNVNTGLEIMSCVAMPVLAYDFTTLSFVLMPQKLYAHKGPVSYPTKPGYSPPGNFNVYLYKHEFCAMIMHSGVVKEFLFPDRMTNDTRKMLMQLGQQSGRQLVTDLAAKGFSYTPLKNPLDGWVDTEINRTRHYWAYLQGHKTIPPILPADYTGTIGKIFGAWGEDIGFNNHLFYSTDPRWGFSCYSSMIAAYMWTSANTTFMAHPNGTYAFYCDTHIYNTYGVVNGAFLAQTANVLPSYEPKDIMEHVVFDTVHFEFRNQWGKATGKSNSTFVKLYNKAVANGLKAQKLDKAAFATIEYKDYHATFGKEVYTLPSSGGMQIMILTAKWGEGTWRHQCTEIQGGAYNGGALIGQQGMLIGMNFGYGSWKNANGDDEFPHQRGITHKQFRVADPIVLTNLR
jgi:hypothetical protein